MKDLLFDLDGTLLQIDNDLFLAKYEEVIRAYFKELGYNSDEFVNLYNSSFYSMINNDGSITNEEVFFSTLAQKYDINQVKNDLNSFYETKLDDITTIIKRNSYPKMLINLLKKKGYKLILATNPLFPKEFTYKRIKWAGLEPTDFSYITTYDNSSYSKPNRSYYLELIKKNNLDINNLVMIGNDIDDDFKYLPEQIERILVTDYLINRKNAPLDMKHMTLEDLYKEALENRI